MSALNNHHNRAPLPPFYAITPPDLRPEHADALIAAWQAHDIRLAQLRLGANHGWQTVDIAHLLDKTPHITWYLNSAHLAGPAAKPAAEPWAERFTRLHLKAAHLISPAPAITRAMANATSIAASVHTLAEWQAAKPYNPTFITLSPILPTQSHPAAPPLGWANMAALIARIRSDTPHLPHKPTHRAAPRVAPIKTNKTTATTTTPKTPAAIFALGGLTSHDLTTARTHGADGIAGIRSFTQ